MSIKSHSDGDDAALLEAAIERIRRVDVQAIEARLKSNFNGSVSEAIKAIRDAHLFDGHRAMPENVSLPTGDDPITFFLALAELAAKSMLARYVLLHRGLNWRKTDYLFDPEWMDAIRRGKDGTVAAAPTADRIFSTSPVFRAAQERFGIEREQLTRLIARPDMQVASLPCGRMRDLLAIDYAGVGNRAHILGIDLDKDALTGAAEFAAELGVDKRLASAGGSIKYLLGDALREGFAVNASDGAVCGSLDVLHSAGLVMYLTDAECLQFFRNVRASLKDGGAFVVSQTMTKDEWKKDLVPKEDILVEQIFVPVIVQAMWVAYARTRAQTTRLLEEAGFRDIVVYPDRCNMFPTWVAFK